MEGKEKTKVVIVTGMSGAGKTHAANWFEDHGYYCIDNMPPELIVNFLSLMSYRGDGIRKAAFVVDIRSEHLYEGLQKTLDFLDGRDDMEYQILFIDASDASLIRRYNETRRSHPLANGSTSREVIEKERSMLRELRQRADLILDTTNIRVSRFNREMERMFIEKSGDADPFSINISSFGYKHGNPPEVDMIFDVRFIPNPYHVESLRHLTGNNKKVAHYVLKQGITKEFISQLENMIDTLAPAFEQEGKSHLNIAFGCTGGQHRSVAIANEMFRRFSDKGYRVTLEHREV